MSGGFAELYAAREQPVRPAPAIPPLAEGELPPWVDGLSKDARRTLLYNLQRARNRNPLTVPQDELDQMTDDEKWAWAEAAVRAEQEGHQ